MSLGPLISLRDNRPVALFTGFQTWERHVTAVPYSRLQRAVDASQGTGYASPPRGRRWALREWTAEADPGPGPLNRPGPCRGVPCGRQVVRHARLQALGRWLGVRLGLS